MIIDAWIQHPTLRFAQQPMFNSLWRWTKQGPPTVEVPLEFTLATMKQAGVAHALVSAWYGPQGALISNDEVAGWVEQSTGMLSGVCSVDLMRPMEAVRELRRCVRKRGFKALRMLPWWWNLPPNDRHYYPLYAECCELGVPFCLQVGHTGPLMPSEPGRPIPYLDQVALDFPELVIVGGHIGYPWTVEMISLATKYEHVYIDTSAYTSKRYPPELAAYLRAHGRRKVLFGSNYPMITPEACLEDLDALNLDEATRADFLAGNAQRVFRLAA